MLKTPTTLPIIESSDFTDVSNRIVPTVAQAQSMTLVSEKYIKKASPCQTQGQSGKTVNRSLRSDTKQK